MLNYPSTFSIDLKTKSIFKKVLNPKSSVEIDKKNVDKKKIENLFVTIPKGTVEMRDDRVKKVWTREIESFRLAKFPVTQYLYAAIMNENPATFKGEKLPVETLSWIEAVKFCNKLSETLAKSQCYVIDNTSQMVSFNAKASGFRLPTEAEWQYACQAGEKNTRYGELEKIAWYKKMPTIVLRKLDKSNPILGDFMTCLEMFGNGVRIFMMKPFMVPIGFFVVVAGAM